MKEQITEATKPLEQIGVELANKGLSWLNSAEAFTKEQIPDFVEQVVKLKIVHEGILVGLGVTLLLISTPLFITFFKEFRRKDAPYYNSDRKPNVDYFRESVAVPCILLGTISAFLGLCVTVINLFNLVKVLVAPKVYLLEYFTTLVK